jgi:hypothetical protein
MIRIPSANEDTISNSAQLASNSADRIDIVIRHKIRGGGGVWVDVAQDERLRVSDLRTGKNLRLVLSTYSTDIQWEHSNFLLLSKPNKPKAPDEVDADWTSMEQSEKSFQIKEMNHFVTGTKSQRRAICHLDLKLFVMYRTIKFRIVANRPEQPDMIFDSIQFITYNSGTAEAKRQAREANEPSRKRRSATKEDPGRVSTDPTDEASSPTNALGDNTAMEVMAPLQDTEQPQNPFRDAWTRMEANLSVEGFALAQRCSFHVIFMNFHMFGPILTRLGRCSCSIFR